MNYRHGFHAGNFADVFKHALLARLLVYLARKETPFRVIDTHAGEGAYDLSSDEAARTGEWRDGIGRLADLSSMRDEARALLLPYLQCIGPFDEEGRLRLYPGSPAIAQRLMRAQDRAIFCELRPDGFTALRRRFGRDARVKALHIDGYIGLGGFVPPKERRGVVLIDPPFERTDELQACYYAFRNAYNKWPTGIYALWHPSKNVDNILEFQHKIAADAAASVMALSLDVGGDSPGLRATGMVVVNPPYGFDAEAQTLLASLCPCLAQGNGAGFSVAWLAPPR